jgi:FXSXX-COOH protein
VNEDIVRHEDGLIDVSKFTLRQLATEVDESSLTHTLRRLLDSEDGNAEEIAGFTNYI